MICHKCSKVVLWEKMITPDGRVYHIHCWDKTEEFEKMKITKSELKKMIKEEIQSLNEVDLEDVRLPSNVQRFTDKLIQQIKRVNLTKTKQYALVGRIIAALNIDVSKLGSLMSIIKKDLGPVEVEVKKAMIVDTKSDESSVKVDEKIEGKVKTQKDKLRSLRK